MNEKNKYLHLKTKGVVLIKPAYVYDLLNPVFTFFSGRLQNKKAIHFLNPAPEDQVLDLGCATGEAAIMTARKLDKQKGGFVTGIDASYTMINVARKKIKKLPCSFETALCEKTPF